MLHHANLQLPALILSIFPPASPFQPKTSSFVTFPKELVAERNLPPPPVPPPLRKPVHGLPDRAASQGNRTEGGAETSGWGWSGNKAARIRCSGPQ